MPYDNRGKVSIWKRASENPKAPILTGTVVAHRNIREGEEVDISLWKNHSDNPKAPTLTGKLKDKFETRADRQVPQYDSAPPPYPKYEDEDLPF